jgi:hypothetical protein
MNNAFTRQSLPRQYIANHIAQEHYRNAHDENLNELPRLHGVLPGANNRYTSESQHTQRHGHHIQRPGGGEQHSPSGHIGAKQRS